MPTAYSYVRFSSERQGRGDSVRRQTERAQRYIDQHPELELTLDTTLNLNDHGLSAYSGLNLTKGALGVFLRACEDGIIEPDSYLLVESFDRLSRETPRRAQALMSQIIDTGITIVTLIDEQVFSAASVDNDPMRLMLSLVSMIRAHDESKTKSDRILASWKARIDKAKDGKQISARVPFWIDPLDKNKTIPDRVAAVKRIYKMAAEGMGVMSITKVLNEEGVPPPTNRVEKWSMSSVRKVLDTPTVLGTLGSKGFTDVPNYYPQIISDKLWAKTRFQGASSKGVRFNVSAHPLSGLMKCAKCGSTAVRSGKTGRARKDGTKNRWITLVCRGSMGGLSNCGYQSIAYSEILGQVVARVHDISVVAPNDHIGSRLFELRQQREQIQDLIDAFGRGRLSATGKANMTKHMGKLADLDAQISELLLVKRPVSQKLIGGAVEAICKGEGTNALFRQVIKEGLIDFDTRVVSVVTHSGEVLSG